MRVKIYDVTGPGVKTFRAEGNLADLFPGDADGASTAAVELEKGGQFSMGAVILERAISPADSFDYREN
jgi:hypothetical protein